MSYYDTSNETKRLGLAGRTVTGLRVQAENESYLVFETTTGDVVWGSYGDCCSETWFADVIGLARLLNHTVESVTEQFLEGDPDDGRTRQDCDSETVERILTEAGECEIRWRNSSNGYYGGAIFVSGNDEDWHSWPIERDTEVVITSDWRAPNRGYRS